MIRRTASGKEGEERNIALPALAKLVGDADLAISRAVQ
jgi:hypothetical protein